MPIKNPEILREIPLFQLLDQQESQVLAQEMDQCRFLAGQLIFQQGDPGGTMFIVKSGQVETFLVDSDKERISLETLDVGGMFGELSLLDNQPRTASARAITNVELVVIDQDDLRILIKAHPDAAIDIMATLSKRLRESNLLIQHRVARNVNEEMPPSSSFGERFSDMLTAVAGDIRFVYFSGFWFFTWIVLNTHLIPGVEAFDPFPFGLLTMVVSLEAIFLSLFVLISQNRQTARDKIRNDIEYAVNLKAEVEIRELSVQMETMQQLILQHFASIDALEEAKAQQKEARRIEKAQKKVVE